MNINCFYKLISCHLAVDKTPLYFKDWDSGNTKSLKVYGSVEKDPEGAPSWDPKWEGIMGY